MAASTAALPAPGPAQLVRAMAAAAPSELSTSPLLGILGVITGAGIVTLTGRMITLGLPDLKGHLGIGFDDGAWIGSAFNIALMFMGPLTVFLGGLIGPRRILLVSATGFTLVCGLLTREWTGASANSLRWLIAGIAVLILGAALLGVGGAGA